MFFFYIQTLRPSSSAPLRPSSFCTPPAVDITAFVAASFAASPIPPLPRRVATIGLRRSGFDGIRVEKEMDLGKKKRV